MKIAINVCYGGFSLSAKAVKRLAEMNGKKCYFFTYEVGNFDKLIPIQMKDIEPRSHFWLAYSVPNPDKYAGSQKNWHDKTDKERQESNKRWEEISLTNRYVDRSDPQLIQVIEQLGKEANGGCADLKIIDIPDGIEYEIEEYDGTEWVAEKHRTWN